ncbi:chromogranin-A [Acanthopagrus latus]|uniref:chromogranin-A n=1 Tax=Acanthopagrus latus TaxID=8177 RepID=UPI00187C60D3|nr:chromogranin-A [Acanthopagrus latus]
MIGRGLLLLAILSSCVLSLPLTPSQLENEDVKVMKCIVEALADVLSRPHPAPVSQDCLVTLKTDDRLVSILRHHNFLKELQEIAVKGGQERAHLQRDAGSTDPMTQTPRTGADVPDRSMLEALGGPGERSILSQKRMTGDADREEEKDENLRDEESPEDDNIAEEVKTEDEERPGNHVSEAEKREDEEQEEKRVNSEESVENKKVSGSGESRDASRTKPKDKKLVEDDEEVKDKRSSFFPHKQEEKPEEEEDEGETKRGSRESLKRWTKRGKALPLKRKAVGKEAQELDSQQEVPHHSKEVLEEEEEEKKKKRVVQRSPEEKELQMIAKRGPEERRALEEEGSASRKSEEPEIESLAAIESELENVAQKLHELRRG